MQDSAANFRLQIGGKIDEATILAQAQPGDLLLSNSGSPITVNGNSPPQNHIVIYIGTYNGVPSIAESTSQRTKKNPNGKSGPQFDTLDNRVTRGGAIQMILRPVGN